MIDEYIVSMVRHCEVVQGILLGQLQRKVDAGETIDPALDFSVDTDALGAKLACPPVILPKS